MAHQSDCSRILIPEAFHTPKTNQWGCTQASGMRMTGPLEAALSRRTGPKPHSRPPSGTSPQTHALGLLENLHAAAQIQTPPKIHGSHRSWIPAVKLGWNGSRRITWFIITVQTQRDSLRGCLWNALSLTHEESSTKNKIIIISTIDHLFPPWFFEWVSPIKTVYSQCSIHVLYMM